MAVLADHLEAGAGQFLNKDVLRHAMTATVGRDSLDRRRFLEISAAARLLRQWGLPVDYFCGFNINRVGSGERGQRQEVGSREKAGGSL